jgi:hypothetical protein
MRINKTKTRKGDDRFFFGVRIYMVPAPMTCIIAWSGLDGNYGLKRPAGQRSAVDSHGAAVSIRPAIVGEC